MKKIALFSVLSLMVALMTSGRVQGQYEDKLGLPGDNLNLYAVMKLFQESETLESFERNLNDENSIINNLDLDGDNRVDYIRVIDYANGDDHTIVLQVALNAYENQDVAVFTVNRDPAGNVTVQLVGDEDLYGRNYIIEPYYNDEGETPNPAYIGNTNRSDIVVTRVTRVEVASWPVIRFIFMPNYVVWHSPWYYGYYPHYWHPWHPHYWDYYYGYHYHYFPHYYGYYHRWDHHRYNHYNDFYYNNHRAHSTIVHTRIQNYSYNNTYSHPETRDAGSKAYVQRHPESRRGSDSNMKGYNTNGGNSRSSASNGSYRSSAKSRQSSSVVSNTRRTTVSSGNNGTANRTYNSGRSTVNNGSNGSGRSNATMRNSSQGRTTIKSGNTNSGRSSASRSNNSGNTSVSKRTNSSGGSAVRSGSSGSGRSSSSVRSGSSGRSSAVKSGERPSGRSSGSSSANKSSRSKSSSSDKSEKSSRRSSGR